MMATGSGVIYPIPPAPPPSTPDVLAEWCTGIVSLARYEQLIIKNKCGFWGVNNPDEQVTSCRQIWSKFTRDELAYYLCQAQTMIEDESESKLGYQWVTEKQRPLKNPIVARWNNVISGGIRATNTIQANAAVDLSQDPCVVGPLATTLTDTSEIKVYYPNTDQEITPGSMVISGGNLYIYIPRCRLVGIDYLDTPEVGWDYSNDTYFQSGVDVVRVYNDPSTNAILVTNHRCSAACADNGCSEYTQDACMYVKQPEIGSIEIYPATYSSGAWSRSGSSLCCSNYRFIQLNYLSGILANRTHEMAVIRLAHSLMPSSPCSCVPIHHLWERDSEVPGVLTRERLNCPFGLSNGAWFAYELTQTLKVQRMSVM